jgi:hypothetical protein
MFSVREIDWGSLPQWLSGVGTLLAVVIALFGDQIRRSWFRPKLEVSLKHLNGEIETLSNGSDARYFRAKVSNRSDFPARDVRLYIVRVDEWSPDKKLFEPRSEPEIPLVRLHHNVYQPRAFIGEPAYFDLISVQDSALVVHTAFDAFSFSRVRQSKTKFRLHVVARSDEAASSIKCLEVEWDGAWSRDWEALRQGLKDDLRDCV